MLTRVPSLRGLRRRERVRVRVPLPRSEFGRIPARRGRLLGRRHVQCDAVELDGLAGAAAEGEVVRIVVDERSFGVGLHAGGGEELGLSVRRAR